MATSRIAFALLIFCVAAAPALAGMGTPEAPLQGDDFNADGNADVIFAPAPGGAAEGNNKITTLSGISTLANSFFENGGGAWSLTAVGDMTMTGGTSDIVETGASGGAVGFYRLGPVTVSGVSGNVTINNRGFVGNGANDWVLFDVADLDGDGEVDLFEQGNAGGALGFNRLQITTPDGLGVEDPAGFVGNGGGDWVLAKLADTNMDTRNDIIEVGTPSTAAAGFDRIQLVAADGKSIISPSGTGFLENGGNTWIFIDAGDLDGDNRADLASQGEALTAAAGFVRLQTIADDGITTDGQGFVNDGGGDWSLFGLAHMNNDNRADLVWTGVGGAALGLIRISITAVGGTSIEATEGFIPVGSEVLNQLSDTNGDGRADLITVTADGSQAVVRLTNEDGISVNPTSGMVPAAGGAFILF